MSQRVAVSEDAQLEQNGFLIVRGALSSAALDALHEATMPLYSSLDYFEHHLLVDYLGVRRASPADIVLPQVLEPFRRTPELRALEVWARVRALASRFLGVEEAPYFGSHMILKRQQGAEGVVPPHQDEAYWDPAYDYKAVACFISTSACSEASGTLAYYRGSHRMGILPHRRIAGARHHGIELDSAACQGKLEPPVPCPMERGDVCFHLARTLHESGPNRMAEPRNGIVLTFGSMEAADVPRVYPWRETLDAEAVAVRAAVGVAS